MSSILINISFYNSSLKPLEMINIKGIKKLTSLINIERDRNSSRLCRNLGGPLVLKELFFYKGL
jgi:hypothetical protein